MRKKELVFILILISCLFLIYQNSLKFDLIWDTKTFIKESVLLNHDVPLLSAFSHGYIYGQLGMPSQSFYYRPVVNLSFMIEKEVWGLRNTTLRLTNIVIFLLAVLFLFWFVKSEESDGRFSLMVVLLFALSPLNVENIVWIVGRCDLFLLLWGVLTLVFFQLFMKKGQTVFALVSLFFFGLGLLSKETFVFFWPLLLGYQWLKKKRITPFFHGATAMLCLLFYLVKTAVLDIGGLHFIGGSGFFDYLHTAVSVLGYYSRILLFPFFFENFNFVNKVTTPWYFLMGLVMAGLMVSGFFLLRKKRTNLFALVLTFLFICPFVLLAFTTLWPFRISSRYMMVPFLGVAWLGVRAIYRLRIKMQNILVISLIILFGSGIIAGMQRYRSERDFWQDALASHPDSSFVLQKLAGICYEESDDFTAWYYYRKALKYPMGKDTAVEISIGLARLAFQRCDYGSALEWLNRLKFSLSSYQAYHISKLKSLIWISLGNVANAEKLLKQTLNRFPARMDIYHLLFEFYVGQEKWDRARDVEGLMKKKFPFRNRIATGQVNSQFRRASSIQRINFYIRHKNYRAAIEALRAGEESGNKNRLLAVELYYRLGDPKSAEKLVNGLLAEYPGDFELRNSLGFFYLRRLNRLDESLARFKESLDINGNQPGIAKLADALGNEKARIDSIIKQDSPEK